MGGGKNVYIKYLEWSDFVGLIQSKFDFSISLSSPYKLCDFRPAYGYLFQDYLSGYDYWGHCDCDLIWGDLSILNELLTKGYDRIGEYGHLILYKNTAEVNSWFKTLRAEGVPSYQKIFTSARNFSFDEFAGMNILVAAHTHNVYEDRLFDDIIFYKKNFWSRRLLLGKDTRWDAVFFSYQKGKLFRNVWRNGQWMKDQSLYVHFQKRKLSIETSDTNHFIVIPNRLIATNRYPDKVLKKLCAAPVGDVAYWKMWLKQTLKRFL